MKTRGLIGLLLATMMLTSTACTTTTRYEGRSIDGNSAILEPDTRISITEVDGTGYDLVVIDTSATSVLGQRDGVGEVEIPFADIRYAEISRIDSEKSINAATGAGSLFTLVGLVLIATTGVPVGY